MTPRMGPVHIALPSDIARTEDRVRKPCGPALERARPRRRPRPSIASPIGSRTPPARPVVILGLDLNPLVDTPAVRAFVEALGAPVFVTPKAKGIFPEDHPLFYGVCAGVSGDAVVCDLLGRADLLVGVGFEPVESDKVWHHTMPLVSIGPMSIATSRLPADRRSRGRSASIAGDADRARLAARPFAWTSGRSRCASAPSSKPCCARVSTARTVGLRADAPAARVVPARHDLRDRRRLGEDGDVAGLGVPTSR